MSTIQTAVLIAHTIIALLIIVLVLLQRGKGADAGAAFGAGASGTVFGARGSSNFFSRATAVMATVFFVSSLALAYMSSERANSVESLLEDAPPVAPIEESMPADELPAVEEALPELADEATEAMPDAIEDELPELEPAPLEEPVGEEPEGDQQ